MGLCLRLVFNLQKRRRDWKSLQQTDAQNLQSNAVNVYFKQKYQEQYKQTHTVYTTLMANVTEAYT